jgi:hypothetical protein
MNTMYLKAASGRRFPIEGNPRYYITDAEPHRVIGSHYYRKAVIDGDVVELTEKDWQDFVDARDKRHVEEAAKAAAAAKAAERAAAKESK